MCALAEFQEWPDTGVTFFNAEEQRRISRFEIPGEDRTGRDYGDTALYYPRIPVEDPAAYRRAHAERLRSLERAAGMRAR